MKKKIIISIVVLIGFFAIYKIGVKLYKAYLINKIGENVEIRSDIIDYTILTDGEKDLKTNDLIYVCELRQSLWDTSVDTDTIQILAEQNNSKYKKFSEQVKKKIDASSEIKNLNLSSLNFKKSDVIGPLCTLVFPDTRIKRSLYYKLLSQKYKIDTGTIGVIDSSKITKEDLIEYRKALLIEEKLRLQF